MAYPNEIKSPVNLAGLGKSMRLFAYINGIAFLGIWILGFIISFMMRGGVISGDPIDISGVENGILVLIVGVIGVGIFVLVGYCQLIMQLKKTGETTSNIVLKKCAKYLFAAAVFNVLLQVYTEVFMVGSVKTLLAEDFSSMSFLGIAFYLQGVIYTPDLWVALVTRIPMVFHFLSAMVLHKWAKALYAEHGSEMYKDLKGGTNFIKIGAIFLFIPFMVGFFAFISWVGYDLTGKALQLISSNRSSPAEEDSSLTLQDLDSSKI